MKSLKAALLRLLLAYAREAGRPLPTLLEDWVLLERFRQRGSPERKYEWQCGNTHYTYIGADASTFCAEHGLALDEALFSSRS
jgi:hypothetical protein